MKKIFLLGLLMSLCSGCTTFREWLGGGDGHSVVDKLTFNGAEKPVRYSDNSQMAVPSNRNYRKMTRSRMEEESELHSQAGSMWVNEGQSSYLFAQNKTRRDGDILNVKLDGPALKQVETKVSVIKKLLKQLEEQQQAELQQKLAENAPAGGDRAPAAEKKKEEPKPAAKDEKEDLTEIQTVATRIVEKQADGNYRIKGAQPFMIGKREYKVIVTGMIRPEDYNDEGVSSGKLLDPQYDVVSIRRNKQNEQNAVF